jgi:cation diffusion facilitator family transporter
MVKTDSETNQRGVRRELFVTLALNVVVVAGKLVAGLIAGSLSVISDAVHLSVDSLNNIVGRAVVKYATAAPDEAHPYGHAKFETLAAFAIAGVLFVTCYQISLSVLTHISNEFERDHIASHAGAEEIERRLEWEFGKVTATIHVEPSP